jgi:hypothetical protein
MMNSLSWMIYAANLVDNMNTLAAIALFVGGVGGGFAYCVGTFPWHEWSWDTAKAKADRDAARGSFRKWGRRGVMAALITLPIATLIPSDRTMYMIAASEAGETIVTSPEAREVFNDLKTIIKSKLKEQLPKT